tara:strand:- start:1496 stop:1795 length:300 start_codon:yes stop_codon:yes gene_type:complete
MNSALLKAATIIAKEEVGNLHFPKEEVIANLEERKELLAKMEKALKLGNAHHGKVKILFEDDKGFKTVETTIWGITDKNILLKKTTILPIRRIHDIKFY